MFLSLAVFATIAGAVILMLKAWHRAWWAKVWVRRTTKLFFILGLLGIALRALGMSQAQEPAGRMPTLTIAGAALLGPVSVFALMLFLSLPAAALLRALLHGVERLLRLRKGAFEETPSVAQPAQVEEPGRAPERVARVSLPTESTVAASDPEASPSSPPSAPPPLLVPRRSLLEGAVIALPTLALAAGVLGIAGAYERTRIVPRPMAFPTLPPSLQHLKILQLTDLHLGAFLDLRGVDALVEDARASAPDLVVITGDFCDHLPWLKRALATVESLKPKLGTFAIFGNHEYYRGADANRRVYEASGVDLLLDGHRTLRVGDAELSLVGIDDPGRGNFDGFYARAVDRALDGASSQAFQLGLCHRPSGFPTLAERGIDLTLSGHTHGAQIGIGERSILERAAPEARLWGRYAIGGRQLYTSSGAGHWFAFRLNCPSEAALVTLERA